VQKVLAHADVLRWSPEAYLTDENLLSSEGETPKLTTWLLVSDRRSLVVLSIDLDLNGNPKAACTILADYDLGTNSGRFSFVDLVFSHEYAVVLQAMGIQASIFSLARPERQDIANVKYSDTRGLAISHEHKYFCLLTRTEGQDLVLVYATTEMGFVKSNSFSPLTYDAQGVKWSPTGDPLLCVWDSASLGSKVSFFTANGHHLRQLDLNPEELGLVTLHPGFEGLGINTLDWISCDGKARIAVFNSLGQLSLQHPSQTGKVPLLNPLSTSISSYF
jgi:WD40 repeat protein